MTGLMPLAAIARPIASNICISVGGAATLARSFGAIRVGGKITMIGGLTGPATELNPPRGLAIDLPKPLLRFFFNGALRLRAAYCAHVANVCEWCRDVLSFAI